MGKRRQKPKWVKRIALNHIKQLISLASRVVKKDKERARRYCRLAIYMSRRYNVTIPKELKARICKGCYIYLKPGRTAIIRKKSRPKPHMTITCKECGHVSRLYLESKHLKRKKTEK
ncbi:MAG: ribonuclease P [Candidatus Diapherotrites archaeon]|nr:ribonuclease P [Candidatus Diapherotrites archaeon]